MDTDYTSSYFTVEVGGGIGRESNSEYIRQDFTIKDHGSKARKLAIEDFMNKLTDRIKLL